MVANAAPYSSKIIRAGALLPDTKLLLAHWNLSDDVEANLRRIQQENLFGKASRSRIAEILAIFKQRYLGDPQVLAALVTHQQTCVRSISWPPRPRYAFFGNLRDRFYVLFLRHQLLTEKLLSQHCNKHTLNDKSSNCFKCCNPELRFTRMLERFRKDAPVEGRDTCQ